MATSNTEESIPTLLSAWKRKRSNLLCSIDVLSDGSEGTGSACLFLSLWSSSRVGQDDRWWEGSPKARYALSLGSDACGRIATDQRFKLAATRAVFCPDKNSLWGWKALQLALQTAGAKQVHLVTSHPFSEKIVERRDNLCPLVRLCDLSEWSGTDGPNTKDSQWWLVYQDDMLAVHGQAIHTSSSSSSPSPPTWTFLYTIRSNGYQTGDLTSFLVVSPQAGASWLKESRNHTCNLPLVDGMPVKCDFLITLDPREDTAKWVVDIPIFTVAAQKGPDNSLLVRARTQSEAWHELSPFYFPWNRSEVAGSTDSLIKTDEQRLKTGSSVYWEQAVSSIRQKLSFQYQMRLPDTEKVLVSTTDGDGQDVGSRRLWPNELKDFLLPDSNLTVVEDDNEIDLHEEDDDSAVFETQSSASSSLELFCLGTGCAAPSAYRGASAYLLRGLNGSENTWNIILEAGEGLVTQLLRYVATCHNILSRISLIWVSHAHWDHYGGLVPLLATIRQMRENASPPHVRSPLLLAPRVVLRFCESMLCQQKPGEWFFGVAHEDGHSLGPALDGWNKRYGSPIVFWDNVPVDHSCRGSFGCVFGLHIPGRRIPFSFGFSGDTRPCGRFVASCKRRAVHEPLDFLLHEATFDESEKEMSVKKKHSTVQEAISVGLDIGAKKILLSHFSQRYNTLPHVPLHLRTQVGVALDGMRLVLV